MSVPPYNQAPGTGDQPEGQPVQPGPTPPPAYDQPPYGQSGPPPGEPGAYEQPRGYAEQGYPPPQQGYGPPYGFQPQTEQKAIWALVASLAGYVACPIVLHVVGWVLANQALRDIRASGGALTGEGMAQAARVLAIIGLVVFALILAGVIVVVVFAGLASVSSY
jgi:Domain of unknown function (DUF4190)